MECLINLTQKISYFKNLFIFSVLSWVYRTADKLGLLMYRIFSDRLAEKIEHNSVSKVMFWIEDAVMKLETGKTVRELYEMFASPHSQKNVPADKDKPVLWPYVLDNINAYMMIGGKDGFDKIQSMRETLNSTLAKHQFNKNCQIAALTTLEQYESTLARKAKSVKKVSKVKKKKSNKNKKKAKKTPKKVSKK